VTGGLSLLAGTAGLWHLNRRRHPLHGDPAQKPMDLGFIALLRHAVEKRQPNPIGLGAD
jgi:citrate/tricarballylate utilization protein